MSPETKIRHQVPEPTGANQTANAPMLASASVPFLDENQISLNQWHSSHQNCREFFLTQAQFNSQVQRLATLINIRLPFQLPHNGYAGVIQQQDDKSVSQTYHRSISVFLRRLVVTGLDSSDALRHWFGDEWETGIKPMHQQERMNYLLTSKSGGWIAVKQAYDILPDETVPFVKPLQGVTEDEIRFAENVWSEWLAMEDWMIGPRWPDFVDTTD